ncbi:MAG: prepilin-type N-terminal cleavage/methylation domain-containing protein [Patescibacteria group bacterium]
MDSLVRSTQKGKSSFLCKKNEKGITLVELVLVVAIISVIAGVSYGMMTGLEFKTDSQTSIDRLVAVIKGQKLKAMLGAYYEDGVSSGTAIYFHAGTNKYTVFTCPKAPKSCLLDTQNTTNVQESMEESVTFLQTSFTNNTIFFEPKSGEIKNFIQGNIYKVTVANVADGSKYDLRFSQNGAVEVIKTN